MVWFILSRYALCKILLRQLSPGTFHTSTEERELHGRTRSFTSTHGVCVYGLRSPAEGKEDQIEKNLELIAINSEIMKAYINHDVFLLD